VRGLQRVRPSVEVATELVAMRDVTFAEANRP